MSLMEERVPYVLNELPWQEKKIILSSVAASVKLRMTIIQKRLEQAKGKLREFEAKYGCNFESFEGSFPDDASLELHEDYVEWGFWRDIYKEAEAVLNTYNFFLGEDR